MKYDAIDIAGKATTVSTGALSADFGTSRLKVPQNPALKRLKEYAARVAAAGGVDAYYKSGGAQGPWGRKGESWLAHKKGATVKTARRSPRPTTNAVADALELLAEMSLTDLGTFLRDVANERGIGIALTDREVA